MPQVTADCHRCPLNKSQTFVPWAKAQQKQWPILFVGQAPGQEEVREGKPFVGPAGRMLYRLCLQAGINKAKVDITNTVACYPPNDRLPTVSEIECCSERLKADIHLSQPELIVAFGKVAYQTLTGRDDDFMRACGSIFPLHERWQYDCPVLVCLHPSFVMRQRAWIDIAVEHLRKAVYYFTDAVQISWQPPKIVIQPTLFELSDYLSACSGTLTSIDLETTGLDWAEDSILGIGIYHGGDTAMAVSWNPHYLPILKRWLEDPRSPKCLQNGGFDITMLKAAGIHLRGYAFDTRLAEHLIHADLPSDLQSLRSFYTNIPPYKPSFAAQTKRLSQEKLLEIAAMDVIATLRVAEAQSRILTNSEKNLLQQLLLPLTETSVDMTLKGIRVDIELLEQRLEEKLKIFQDLEHEFKAYGLNPQSPTALARRFGWKSADAQYLRKQLLKGDIWAGKLLTYRQLRQQLRGSLEAVQKRLRGDRVHIEFYLDGDPTSRLSSRNPNLRHIPSDLRQFYIPDGENCVFAEVEFKDLELWVAMLMLSETNLVSDLLADIPREVVFATIAGRTARSVALELGVSTQQAQAWQDQCVMLCPSILDYHRHCRDRLARWGYITTPFGRRVKAQDYLTPIKATASDVVLYTVLRLAQNCDVRLSVNDLILVHLHQNDNLQEVIDIINRPVEPLNFSFPSVVHSGRCWGDADR